MSIAFLFLSFLATLVFGQVTTSLFSQLSTGDGTYYGGNDAGGHCSLYPLPSFAKNMMRVAMNHVDYDSSKGCGMCIQLTGSGAGSGATPIKGPILAYVNDECPECAKGSVDLGVSGDGRWAISWKAIDCPVGTEKLSYLWQGGQNSYYVKVQVRAHKIPISGLQIANAGSTSYVTAKKTIDNFFECPSCKFPLVFPLNVIITSIDGQQVKDTIASQSSSPVQGGLQVQFNGIGGSSPVPVAQPVPRPVPVTQPVPVPVAQPVPRPVPVTQPVPAPRSRYPKPAPKPVPVPTFTPRPVPQAAAAPTGCVDTPVPGDPNTCAQQKAWGNCNADWMAGRCENTCGRCPTGCVDIPVPGDPNTCAQQASWGNCGADWMAGRCAKSCGRCQSGSREDNGEPEAPNNTGIIVGCVVGGVFGLFVVGLIIFAIIKKRRSQTEHV